MQRRSVLARAVAIAGLALGGRIFAGWPPNLAVAQTQPRPAVVHARNLAVAAWLDTVAARNAKVRLAKGYRIQIYTGPDRAKAMAAKETLYRNHPELQVYLTYQAPNFRLVCGDFLSRLQAQLAVRTLSADFSNPLLVEGQIRLR